MFPTDNSHLLFYQVKLTLKSAVNLVQRQDKNENNLPFFSDELISESLAEVVEG